MFTFIIVFSVIVQSLVALFVLQKNRKSATNIAFFLLLALLVTWAVINFTITNNPYSASQLTLYRLLMATVVAQNTLFFIFAHVYPDRVLNSQGAKVRLYLLLSILAFALALSPVLFTKVNHTAGGARPVGGPGMLVFILHAVISVYFGLRTIYRGSTKAQGISRTQYRLIFYGSIILWGIVPITNFVVSMATQTIFFARISPLYTLAFSSIIAYAIVAQKLFDIRSAVARSVGYVLILGTMSLAYAIMIFGIVNVIFTGASREIIRQIATVILITPLALSFQYIRDFFDRVTNQLFYHDSYDPQDVLDELGTIAVSEIELHRILRETRTVLETAFKSSFIEFILFRNGTPYFESHTHKLLSEKLLKLAPQVHEQNQDLLIVDELGSHHPLRHLYVDADISLSLKLRSHEQVVGYILFGDKKSGDTYTQRDRKLLLIAANELAVAVQNALRFEEIQNFNLTLQAKVNEATKQLRHTNERLKELDETKDDFISMASHQLRTPLTSVKGYISMVLEGDAGKLNAQQTKLLQQSFISSQRMVYLIADLLNVSRLRTGKFVIQPSPVNLSEVVEQEIEQLEETAAAKGLTLTYNKPDDFPTLMLDETKTRQVIMNFADNAIYYTPSGGHIRVELAETPASVELRIVDDGIGVPKAEQHHLFTKFYRARNARKARPDGTGLGLFMAKKVVVAQGGALIFESTEGKGSTFGFVFSKTKLAPPAPSQTAPSALTAAK